MVRQDQVLPTPVSSAKLAEVLEGYDSNIKNFLLQGFREGFHLNYEGERVSVRAPNLKSALENPGEVRKKISKEISAGRIAGPFNDPPFELFRCSPIGLQPKKDGGFRMIQHLSWPHGSSVNDGIPEEFSTVQYHTVALAIQKIKQAGRACFMAKTDIKSAFRIVPIHPTDHELLGFEWEGKLYFDRCLPMGCSASCNIFETFSTALQWAALRYSTDFEMLHVLDDFLFISPEKEKCNKGLQTFLTLCSKIGVPIAEEKTEGPHQILTFLGIELDSNVMEARLPKDKLEKGQKMISEFMTKEKVTLTELQSLTGFLNFTTSVILPGRPFLRKLINLSKGLRKHYYKARLTKEVKRDLSIWLEFLNSYNGASFFIEEQWVEAEKLHLYTDAAKSLGYGLIMGKKWVSGKWGQEAVDLSISALEMYPILLALLLFSYELKGKSLVIHTDNEALVHVFNNKSSKDPYISNMLRELTLVCLRHNLRVRAVHIPGHFNSFADALSRLQVSKFKAMAPWAEPEPVFVPQQFLPHNLLRI